MRQKSSLLGMVVVLVLFAWTPAVGSTIGPVNPPPSGGGFSGAVGNSGRDGGVTWSYSGLNPGAHDALFWGLSEVAIFGNFSGLLAPLNSGPAGNTTQAATGVSLSALDTVATFTFGSPWAIQRQSGPPQLADVRLVVTALTPGMNWVNSSDPDVVLDKWLQVTGNAFQVNLVWQASHAGSGNWDSLLDYYDSVSLKYSSPTSEAIKSLEGGFWYNEAQSVPEADTLQSLVLGLTVVLLAGLTRSRLQ